jgi:hypothetical protein
VLLVEVISPRLTEDIPMTIQQSTPMTPLRARMIADMISRNLGPASQTSHLLACTLNNRVANTAVLHGHHQRHDVR